MAARGTITLCLILGLLAAANAVPFDFFYLVLKWPGSSCTVSDGKCCVPKDGGYPAEDFLVESFQPFDVSINKPLVSCRNSEPFDIDKLDPIENSINNYWSNIACPPSSTVSTLKSAWKSYGVCSRLEQLDYFKAALELRTQADVLGALTDQGIMPVLDMYSLDKIKWAVKQKLGVTPGVLCNDGPFAKQHLDKVYICVDTDAKTFIECPKLPATTCTESIIFHPFYTWMLNGTFAYDSKIMLN